ncbi:hypothetical protein MNBD_GAMMA09-3014 [hydrothermal vent metagenome]|uniref:SAM-dependent methyltransferase n=1 Tax=hydrothermal vent metagenome TaxID=652676 RepID=A0A3B0XFQ0_9ZZZZ
MKQKKPIIIDGIQCYCPDVDHQHTDYPEVGLENLYLAETQHFWFISRCEYIISTFKQYIKKNSRIIEIGAGTGNVSRKLMEEGYKPAVGELHLSGLRYAQSYGIKECYQFDLYDPPFSDSFDAIGLFDVLEHLSDSDKALKNIHSMLHKNGLLFITVPAHMWLWNREDRIAGHKIRYTKKTLSHTVEQAGFEIIECRYFFVSILPLLWVRSLLQPDNISKSVGETKSNEIHINPIVNKILLALCRFENKINHLLPNFSGGSLLMIVKKI